MTPTSPFLAKSGHVRLHLPSLDHVTSEVIEDWSSEPVRGSHNCLSFALAARGARWLTPGSVAENTLNAPPAPAPKDDGWVVHGLLKDGFIPVPPHQADPAREHVFSIFMGQSRNGVLHDFHARRLAPCGQWFEKHGTGGVKAYNGQADMHSNSHGAYVFGGFFKIPHEGTRIFFHDVKERPVTPRP